jgi:hypothetical protein
MSHLRNLGRFLGIAALGVFLSSCGDYQWNQKLTVTVDTPTGVKSGSSVMKMRLSNQRSAFNPPEARGVSFSLSGEAVVLELAPGRYLFALLKGVPSLGEQLYPKMDAIEAAQRLKNDKPDGSTKVILTTNDYPLLVTFTDINDPASVKRVDPTNLEAAFGPGYRLNGIMLTLTKEPVIKGKVEKVLSWLPATNFIIPPEQQPRYVKDQTVEQKIMPSDFIDGSTLKLIREKEAIK